jgi:hypothetical protein
VGVIHHQPCTILLAQCDNLAQWCQISVLRINANLFLWLIVLIGATLLMIFITNRFILTVNFYERNGQPMSGIPDMESLVYERVKKVIYVYAMIYLVIKVFAITVVLATGLYFFDIQVSFRDLLRVAVWCEFVFLIPAALKIGWFWQDRNNVDLLSWQNFYPLSAASLISDTKPAFLLPMQTLNIFEVSYWLLLAAGIEKIAGIKFDKALKIICCSYMPALFIWVVFVIYFTVIYFPQSY